MNPIEQLDQVREMASKVAKEQGCLLYDLEFIGKGKASTLRIFIDKKEGLIDVDDCAKVSSGLSLLIDEKDIFPEDFSYNLEVSSPGVERKLKEPWHFGLVHGQQVWLKLKQSLSEMGLEVKKFKSSKVVTAELVESDEEKIRLSIDGQEVQLPFDKIEKAKTIFDFGAKAGSTKR